MQATPSGPGLDRYPDRRQREALPFICEWVEAVALLPQAWRDTAWALSQENVGRIDRLVRAG
jgi:hypothetical protein